MGEADQVKAAQEFSSSDPQEKYVHHYWAKSMNVSEEELKRAIEKVGNSVQKVKAYLRNHAVSSERELIN